MTIPAKWRKELGEAVIMVKKGNEIRIIGIKDFKLSDLFDSIEFEGEIDDLKDVKKLKGSLIDDILGL